MSNLPIKPIPGSAPTQVVSKPEAANDTTTSPATTRPNDALVVSVARTQPHGPITNEAAKDIDQLVGDIFTDKDSIGAAHGKLDAARVHSILNDD